MIQNRSKIQVVLIVALSLLVAVGVLSYVNGIKSKIRSEYETRPAIVVKKQIPAGTSLATALSQEAVTNAQFPTSNYPTDALESLDGISGELVARYTLQPGQLVLRESFGTQNIQAGSLLIPDGFVAVSFSVTENARVGSFMRPGSRVSIFASGQVGESTGPITQTLFTGVLVLAVGSNVDPSASNNTSDENALVTLAVTSAQAKKLIHASQFFSLYFGILGPKVEFDFSSQVSNNSLFKD